MEGKIVRGERKQILDLFIIGKFRGRRGYGNPIYSSFRHVAWGHRYSPWLRAFTLTISVCPPIPLIIHSPLFDRNCPYQIIIASLQ